jgi:glycosyltransferase involved in cell wall biosynthesis
MKILHISNWELTGGAAKAANRIHKELLKNDIVSIYLVQHKSTKDINTIKLDNLFIKFRNIVDKLILILYNYNFKEPFSPGLLKSYKIRNIINNIKPDVVHLHWISGGMLNIKELDNLNIPIVWTFHDLWPITGGCHVQYQDNKCINYLSSCGKCPMLNSKIKKDLSYFNYENKRNFFNTNNVNVIALTNWHYELICKSKFLINKNIIKLPNILDTDLYSPKSNRKIENKFNILCGGLITNNKNINSFFESLNYLDHKNVNILFFGSKIDENIYTEKFNFKYLGYINDENEIVEILNNCDVVVVPSYIENLSNMIFESLSCGVPVVAFNTGGNSDLILHKENGYLAKPFDILDLAKGIDYVLGDNKERLSLNARKLILEKYNHIDIIKKYLELYKSILN